MRLRKQMKRTAAAALALSMAISAATPAWAAYKIDMSTVSGDVEIKQDEQGNITISVGGEDKTTDFSDGNDKDDSITVTGDNTKDNTGNGAATTADAENTPAAEQAGETGDAADPEPEDNYAFSTMDLTPEDYGQPAGDAADDAADPADPDADASESETREPERTVTETEDGTVIEYEDYDVDPDVQVTKPEAKAEAPEETPAPEDDDKDTVTYESKTATNSISKTVGDAARKVLSIINNSTKELKITLDNLKIDAGSRDKAALSVSGIHQQAGPTDDYKDDYHNVTLELSGKNELTGGSGLTNFSNIGKTAAQNGIDYSCNLTITGKDEKASLEAKGGNAKDDGITSTGSDTIFRGGSGIAANEESTGMGVRDYGRLSIEKANIKATGGDAASDKNGNLGPNGGDGIFGLIDHIKESTVVAKGGDCRKAGMESSFTLNPYGGDGISSISSAKNTGHTEILNSHISATGGSVELKSSYGGGGSGMSSRRTDFLFENSTVVAQGGNGTSAGDSSSMVFGGNGISTDIGSVEISGSNSNITVVGGNATHTNGGSAWSTGYYNSPNNLLEITSGVLRVIAGKVTGKNGFHESGAISWSRTEKIITVSDGANMEIYGEIVGNGSSGKVDSPFTDVSGTVTYYENVSATTDGNGKAALTGTATGRVTNNVEETLTDKEAETVPVDALAHDWKDTDDIHQQCTICHITRETPPPEEPDEPVTPVTPEENGSDSTAALELRVTDAEGVDMPFAVSQSGAVRTYTASADTATLTGNMETLRYLKEHGAQTIVFVTNQQTTSFDIDAMLAQSSNGTFYLTHTGAEEAQMLVVN